MASIINESYPADGTVTQLKETCEDRGWKLVGKLNSITQGSSIDNGVEKLVDTAHYESKEWRTETWKSLDFVVVNSSDDIESIKTQHEANGQSFIFSEQIYIQNKITRIAGFGVPYEDA